MKPVDFKEIKPEYLLGTWNVRERILSRSDPNSIYALANQHHFLPNGTYKVSHDAEVTGQWEVTAPADLIRNPLIRFNLNNEFTNAIITRLLCIDDCIGAELTIYMSSGLELILSKN
jgi:hypothetical protein